MAINRIVATYAEIALKGRNRGDFEAQLRANMQRRLAAEGIDWPVVREHDRITVRCDGATPASIDSAMALLGEVSGIAEIAAVTFLPRAAAPDTPDPDRQAAITDCVLAHARTAWNADASFAVRVRRGDKRFPLSSEALERHLGGRIIEETRWQRVNLDAPDRVFRVDVHPSGILISADRVEGPGGLPVFTGGRVLALLSVGIDSPVAAAEMARRGCAVDFLHFTAGHPRAEVLARTPIATIARQLSRRTLASRLWLVPYTHFDLALADAGAEGLSLVLFRRFMARVADRLAADIDAPALVCGDSLGQVASQTLENMVAVSAAIDRPLLRPLVARDKKDIVAMARALGTFEPSTLPYKDCCALLSRHPCTRTTDAQMAELEHRTLPNYESLIAQSLADAVRLDFDTGRPATGSAASPP